MHKNNVKESQARRRLLRYSLFTLAGGSFEGSRQQGAAEPDKKTPDDGK